MGGAAAGGKTRDILLMGGAAAGGKKRDILLIGGAAAGADKGSMGLGCEHSLQKRLHGNISHWKTLNSVASCCYLKRACSLATLVYQNISKILGNTVISKKCKAGFPASPPPFILMNDFQH